MVKEKSGLRHVFDSHSVTVTGDTSKKPKVEIVFDKKEVLIDEPITVTYKISGEGQYTDVTCQWRIYTDENSSQSSSENDQSSTELSGEFEFIPQYGVKLGCEIWVTENTGRRYIFDSDTIEILGDNSQIPSASIELDKIGVGIGETISATLLCKSFCKASDSTTKQWDLRHLVGDATGIMPVLMLRETGIMSMSGGNGL